MIMTSLILTYTKPEKAARDVADIKANPLPDKATSWSVNDVCRWLDVLSLGQYSAAFREASVDGPFLMVSEAET